MTMALSSSPQSPAVLTASQFSTHSPFPKLTTSHFFFSTAKPSNQTSYFNLSSSYSSTIDRSWSAKVSFFPAFLKKGKDAKVLKEELLEAIDPLDRGADAIPEDQQRVDEIARKLEAVNPTKEPLKSGLLNGKWELIYTTSQSILQTQRPKLLRSRTNYQAINADTLRAQNMESWPFFNQIRTSKIPVKAPERARGELEITYLDEELRVSRGDKGNLFILKMVDPSYRVPV